MTRSLIILLLSSHFACFGTTASLPDTTAPDPARVWIVGTANAALWTGTFITLNQAWYADYPRQPFHFFNDLPEWQQMDKAGHVWTAYQVSRLSGDVWRWTGIETKKAVWLGGISGLAYQSVIEILDGFSEKWGFSAWDMAANVVGAGAYVSQQLLWKDQRVLFKFSYFPYTYPPDLRLRASELFGSGAERILKDYNAQTYWVSINLRSCMPGSGIPEWLSISLGYNARLMVGGRENIWTDGSGMTVDRSDIKRYRRFFLSADVDLTKIRTRSRFLRSVFSAVNMIKVPAPTLEFNTAGKVRLHGFFF